MRKTFFCLLKRFSDNVGRVSGAFAVSEKNRSANCPFQGRLTVVINLQLDAWWSSYFDIQTGTVQFLVF